nr:MAG TPA: hypothetical protein [Caudoviricetes sp.]
MSGEKKKFNKNKYDQKFHKENYKRYGILFRLGMDDSIIKKLESVPNKTDYIRQLILADIEKNKQN